MPIIDDEMKKSAKPGKPQAPKKGEKPEESAKPTAQPDPGQSGGLNEPASAQEQEAFDRVFLAGQKVLYDKSTHAGIVKMLKSAEPPEALAKAATVIVTQLDEKSRGTIPEAVILPVAAELLGEIAQFAHQAKIMTVDERTIGLAMQQLVISLAEQYGVNPAEVQDLLQAVGQDKAKQIADLQSKYHQQAQPGAPAQPTAPQPEPQPEAEAEAEAAVTEDDEEDEEEMA